MVYSNKAKTACLTVIFYLIGFQLFLQSGNIAWLYAGNIIFCLGVIVFTFYNRPAHNKWSLSMLTAGAVRFSLVASLLALGGCALLCLFNYAFFPGQNIGSFNLLKGQVPVYSGIKTIRDFFMLIFTNSFPVNLVGGSLAAFFTIGAINEKNYLARSGALSSVDI